MLLRDFLAGKRKRYYKPVQLYILAMAIYLVLRSLLDYDPLDASDNRVATNGVGQSTDFQLAAQFMVKHINNIGFLLVFGIALSLKLFFRKRYQLAEYVAVGFFMVSAYVLLGVLSMWIIVFVHTSIGKVQLLILIGYLFYSTASFMRDKKFWPWVKYLLVALLSMVLYISLGFGLSYLIVALGLAG